MIPEAEVGEELSGGQATIFDVSPNAFGFQAPGVTNEQGLLFFVGNSFFNQNWVSSPASTTARDGLGPYYNARSCAACHFKDGRGRPPRFQGSLGEGLLLRLSVPGRGVNGEPLPEPNYGTQLQDQALLGLTREGGYLIDHEEITGTYSDGTSYTLQKPIYRFTELTYGPMVGEVQISPRVGPPITGLGLLEAVPEATLLALADENDVDNDGISGRPNYVWDRIEGKRTMGRFGWKANQSNLRHQTAEAFAGDVGIKTTYFPEDNCRGDACDPIFDGGSPEIDDDDLEKVVLYVSTLAVPARRDWEDIDVLSGKQLFEQVGCTGCHIPQLQTGKHPTFDALSNQTIRPYTDLLLHDMGEALADNREDYEATGREWRTPPLWGIGLVETVNGHTFFLHDGRARNLEEAILWHGGEGEASKEAFKALSTTQRAQIITFLESL